MTLTHLGVQDILVVLEDHQLLLYQESLEILGGLWDLGDQPLLQEWRHHISVQLFPCHNV